MVDDGFACDGSTEHHLDRRDRLRSTGRDAEFSKATLGALQGHQQDNHVTEVPEFCPVVQEHRAFYDGCCSMSSSATSHGSSCRHVSAATGRLWAAHLRSWSGRTSRMMAAEGSRWRFVGGECRAVGPGDETVHLRMACWFAGDSQPDGLDSRLIGITLFSSDNAHITKPSRTAPLARSGPQDPGLVYQTVLVGQRSVMLAAMGVSPSSRLVPPPGRET